MNQRSVEAQERIVSYLSQYCEDIGEVILTGSHCLLDWSDTPENQIISMLKEFCPGISRIDSVGPEAKCSINENGYLEYRRELELILVDNSAESHPTISFILHGYATELGLEFMVDDINAYP